MALASDAGVSDIHHQVTASPISMLPSHQPEDMASADVSEPFAIGEPAPISCDDLLLPTTTPPSTSMDTPPPKTGAPRPPSTEVLLDQVEPSTEVAPPSGALQDDREGNHAEPTLPEKMIGEDSRSDKPMYPPPVEPTQTYHPRVPTLSVIPVTKPPASIKAPTSKFNRRSWLPSEHERVPPPISPISHGSGKINRSPSIASLGTSAASSAHSATIQIPEPGATAYTKKPHHARQQSDPKYLRFMSAVSENQKRNEPERYVGYAGLVSHMTETQNLLFRRFDEIHVRLLLYLQDQIAQLEAQLRMLDEQNIADRGVHNGTFREDIDEVRVDIMERLRMLVGEYDTMILAFSKMQECKTSDKAIRRLKGWLKKYNGGPAGRQSPLKGGAIARDELEWLDKANDLANLSSTTATGNASGKPSTLTRLFPGKKR